MPHDEAGYAHPCTSPLPLYCQHIKQQLREPKRQAAPAPPPTSDNEDILEGLEREYTAAVSKLQLAHDREMLLSSRVADMQKKLQASTQAPFEHACSTHATCNGMQHMSHASMQHMSHVTACSTHVTCNGMQAAAEEAAASASREKELAFSLKQAQVSTCGRHTTPACLFLLRLLLPSRRVT